ncbi:MAG: CBS domain-containing protein [Planctomycetes bacterium]|nr:CBS domain-containing protein [Planctomycetota bacterium]
MNQDLERIRVRDVMNQAVQWAEGGENLRAAADRMAEHRIRALLVRGRTDVDLPGILTSKDVVNLIGAHDVAVLDQLHVDDACTRPAICVPDTTNLLDCINLMRHAGVRRVPVLRGTEVVGVLSFSDVFTRLLQRGSGA